MQARVVVMHYRGGMEEHFFNGLHFVVYRAYFGSCVYFVGAMPDILKDGFLGSKCGCLWNARGVEWRCHGCLSRRG